MDTDPSPRWDQELREAIETAGGFARVAEALGVSRPAVHRWLELDLERGLPRRVPAHYCLALERLLGRPGLARRLRPDVFDARHDLEPLTPPTTTTSCAA